MRTYGALALDQAAHAWVIPELEPHAAIRLKEIFRGIPKGSRAPFILPASPNVSADLMWFTQRYPLAGEGDALGALGRQVDQWRRVQAEAEKIAQPGYEPPDYAGFKEGAKPEPHQAATVELLRRFGGLLCADDTGLGKTWSIMAACMLPGALPATICVDRNLQIQFQKRFSQFTSLTTHCVRKTTPYALPAVDVRIFSWTQLDGWADVLPVMGHGLVAGDEAELRRGDDSARGRAARGLFEAGMYRLLCSATPSYNYAEEWWNMLSYVRPEVLGELESFKREWCFCNHKGKWILSNPRAFGTYLREQHAIIRKRKDRDRVNRMVRTVPYEAEGLAAMEHMACQLAVKATSGTFHERGEAARQLDLLARQATGIAKAKGVAEIVRAIVESGEPVLLSGHHLAVYDIWMRELADLKPAKYTGRESLREKAEAKRRFLEGETDVFILANRAGRGLDDLQERARYAVVGELDWSNDIIHQIIGRLDRRGSIVDGDPKGTIDALILVADDGSDPVMQDVIGVKSSMNRSVLDPDAPVQTRQSDETGLQRLVEHYLAKARAG